MSRLTDEIEDWFTAAGSREQELRRVDALSSGMLGYGLMPYKPRSAKETTMTPLIALAAQKRHLSLYVCAVVDGAYLAEARAERLGKVSCGKSCIRFTSLDQVDADELLAVVRDAVAATSEGRNAYAAVRD